MIDNSTSQTSLNSDEQDKLRELTAQSWNMELAISGVAMYAILMLPDLLDQLFDYFSYNIMTHTAGLQGMLPSLAYSMLKAGSYVLFVAFLVNFIMRAYWVGLVGLLAVYPSGIHYDRIPFMSGYAQKRMEVEYGPLDRYIIRLDRRCNIVFALAFQFVFMFIVFALMYLATGVVYSILRPLISNPVWEVVKIVAYVLMVLFFISSIIISRTKVREHPTGMKLNYQYNKLGRLITWGLHRPSSYISNTFYSHIPQKSIARTIMIVFTIIMIVFTVEFVSDMSRSNRRASLFNKRHLYTARVDSQFADPMAYDNLRGDNNVDVAAIQADVIREPYIRLFVAYPKALDTLLTKVAIEPEWSDTLSRQEKRERYAEWSTAQLTRLLHITVNDSLHARPDILYTELSGNGQRGWQTVLIPSNLKVGKNLIRIGIKSDSQSKVEEITAIPFWYVPEQ